jgi:hypothetical protein
MMLYEHSPNTLWVGCLVMGVLAAALALVKPAESLKVSESQSLKEARQSDL